MTQIADKYLLVDIVVVSGMVVLWVGIFIHNLCHPGNSFNPFKCKDQKGTLVSFLTVLCLGILVLCSCLLGLELAGRFAYAVLGGQ